MLRVLSSLLSDPVALPAPLLGVQAVLAGLASLLLQTVAELGGVQEVVQDADSAHAKRWVHALRSAAPAAACTRERLPR